MRPPYLQLSGFENETFDDYYRDGFLEVLDTNMACDVELCNYDLSERKPIRVIITNRVQDTELQSLMRQMLAPIGTCKAGMYVYYKGRYWLIVSCVDDNGVYEKAVLAICNQLLTWVNSSGKVIQRWANAVSASQYNNGETNMKFYFVRSDQLLISLPDDDESLTMPQGLRFVIDSRCKVYERTIGDDVTKKTDFPLTTYQLTRSDTVLYDYTDSGHMEMIATQDEKHDSDGYYKIDGKGYWLCDVFEDKVDKKRTLSSAIISDTYNIYNNIEAGIFRAEFYDIDGKLVEDITPSWEVKCDFLDSLDITIIDDYISIAVSDQKLINKSFELCLSADGYKPISTTITIKAFI